MPATALAVVPAVFTGGGPKGFGEGCLIELLRATKGGFQVLGILCITHPKVGVMVQVAAEDLVAVCHVGSGVEDVLVPEDIDGVGGYHTFAMALYQGKPALVLEFCLIGFGQGPTLTFAGIAKFHLNHFKVEGGYAGVDAFGD